jgi:hypothetical protein
VAPGCPSLTEASYSKGWSDKIARCQDVILHRGSERLERRTRVCRQRRIESKHLQVISVLWSGWRPRSQVRAVGAANVWAMGGSRRRCRHAWVKFRSGYVEYRPVEDRPAAHHRVGVLHDDRLRPGTGRPGGRFQSRELVGLVLRVLERDVSQLRERARRHRQLRSPLAGIAVSAGCGRPTSSAGGGAWANADALSSAANILTTVQCLVPTLPFCV